MAGFTKKDTGKVDLTLMPMEAVEGISRVLQRSVDSGKYDRDNWRLGLTDPEAQRRILAAQLRHYAALQRGETLDPDSGLHHAHHIACNAAFLSAFATINERAAQGEVEARADEILRDDFIEALREDEAEMARLEALANRIEAATCQGCGGIGTCICNSPAQQDCDPCDCNDKQPDRDAVAVEDMTGTPVLGTETQARGPVCPDHDPNCQICF